MLRKGLALVAILGVSSAVFGAEGPMHKYFTTSDGLKIHYMEQGSGSPVVLVHGYTGSAEGNWFSNGVADALIGKHRVIAIDVRGHGQSDKPHEAARYGDRLWSDVIELMNHLDIEKAHIHGYSMGGMITTQLLAHHPGRFVTAAYGGSGVRETDPEWLDKVPADKEGTDPQEAEARSTLQGSPSRDDEALGAIRESFGGALRSPIDLTSISIPVLGINGEYDSPIAKTHRMKRELKNFRSVVLPGKSHLTAIMAGYIPKEYITTLVDFIDSNDIE